MLSKANFISFIFLWNELINANKWLIYLFLNCELLKFYSDRQLYILKKNEKWSKR